MAISMLAQLHELQREINTSQNEWNNYLASVRAESEASTAVAEPTLHNATSVVLALQNKFNSLYHRNSVLAQRHENNTHVLPANSPSMFQEFLLRHLQRCRSTETISSYLARELTKSRAYIGEMERLVELQETQLTVRLARLADQMERCQAPLLDAEIVAVADHSFKARGAFEGMEQILRHLEECAEIDDSDEWAGGVRANREAVELCRVMIGECLRIVALLELSLLKMMGCMAKCGIRVARQTLITEFFAKADVVEANGGSGSEEADEESVDGDGESGVADGGSEGADRESADGDGQSEEADDS